MHNLTMKQNGVAEMAFVGETPWHGLGQEMRLGASIDEWLVAAGMSWSVKRSKVRYATTPAIPGIEQQLTEWDDHHCLFRSDTKAPLGIVSKKFKVVQPKQVLEFFRDLCETNRFAMETAGTLRGGSIYWALASIKEEELVGRGDALRGYVLLSTACDGTRRTTAKNTSVRVVCNNTLTMADSEAGRREVSVSHRSQFNPEDVKTDLGIARTSFEKFMATARALAAKKLTPAEFEQMQCALFGAEQMTAEEKILCLDSKHAMAVQGLFHGGARGAELATAKGTAWGYVNAVTEYVDHFFPSRSDENRLTSAWFGFGDRLKNQALTAAIELTQ